MRVLAIDPATACGWAVFEDGKPVAGGVWDLAPKRHEGGGMRFIRLSASLRQVFAGQPLDMVFYELVRGHKGTDAAQIYGGIVATVTRACEEAKVPYAGVPVATIKRTATGNGNADKTAMVAAASRRWPEVKIEDDNHADALWCGVAGLVEVGEAVAT